MSVQCRSSNVFFLMIWMFCVSFAIGTHIYYNEFIPVVDQIQKVYDLMMNLAIFETFASVFAIIFMTCAITHIIPTALFLLPLIITNFTLCSLGLMAAQDLSIPTQHETLFREINFIGVHRHHADHQWLLHSEHNNPCCGVYSYLDYPVYFAKSTNISRTISQDCCKDRKDKACTLGLDNEESNKTILAVDLYKKLHCELHSRFDVYYKEPQRLSPHPTLKERINTCGCYLFLHNNVKSLFSVFYMFFIAIIIATPVMFYIYVKYWFKTTLARTRRKENRKNAKDKADKKSAAVSTTMILEDHVPSFGTKRGGGGGRADSMMPSPSLLRTPVVHFHGQLSPGKRGGQLSPGKRM